MVILYIYILDACNVDGCLMMITFKNWIHGEGSWRITEDHPTDPSGMILQVADEFQSVAVFTKFLSKHCT